MDKYEYKLKLDQMKSLAAEGKYEEAAEIVDTINWRKIKNINALVKAGEIYENVGRYDESKEILLTAYDKSPIGRMIIYRLAQVAIKTKSFDEANEYYQEFVQIAPHDNLKYVLKYEINKAQGADIGTLIGVLEELKEQEYSEEWAYELAYLYHQAGMSEKCIEACDELILWFGDGVYVERALELKMLYQPLTKQQEEKYRAFRQKKDGIVEVHPEDELESGEIVAEPVQIPKVQMSAERFNTQNLQEELRKSMQEIMNATEKDAVDDTMDNIKKMVEDIPYLRFPEEKTEDIPEIQDTSEIQDIPEIAEIPQTENVPEVWDAQEAEKAEEKETEHIESEVSNSSKSAFGEMLIDDDGQMSLNIPGGNAWERQITGQICIEDVLAEWEKTKRAAETAMMEAEQKKLETAKAKALQEAGDIMDRLADVIPKFDSGFSPKDLLDDQYRIKDGQPIEEDKAAEMVANMNQILQQEIDRLSSENAQMDEQLAAVGVKEPVYEEKEPVQEEKLPEIAMPEDLDFGWEDENFEEIDAEKTQDNIIDFAEQQEKIEEAKKDVSVEDVENAILAETARQMAKQAIQETTRFPKIDFSMEEETKAEEEDVLPEIEEPENFELPDTISRLSKEQKEIFTYFVPINGMEQQLCQAMTGAMQHLIHGKTAATGNMIIQGGSGSGKTVLATNVIKALQKEIGKPSGKIGKIEASALNQKDARVLLKKVAGGCLIIEKAGDISKETAKSLSLLLEKDTSGLFVIIEDTKRGIEKALSKDAGFASRFSEKVNIPIFTNDELVSFAKTYAKELGYTIDEMGILALYNCISNIEHADRETTLTEVKDIVDSAVEHSDRGGLKKVFSIITSRRYDEDDYVILREKDFEL